MRAHVDGIHFPTSNMSCVETNLRVGNVLCKAERRGQTSCGVVIARPLGPTAAVSRQLDSARLAGESVFAFANGLHWRLVGTPVEAVCPCPRLRIALRHKIDSIIYIYIYI